MKPVFYERREAPLYMGPIYAHPFPAHMHDVCEIVGLSEGQMEVTIANERYVLQAGDIAVVFPTVPHSYVSVSSGARGLTLIFNIETISEFTNRFRTMQPSCPLLSRDERHPEMDLLISRLLAFSDEENHPLRLGLLHLFLSYLFMALSLQPIGNTVRSELHYQILHYISDHFTEPLSLESTAHALNISAIHLSHIFSQQLRINFRQYINTLRIEHACTLLENPDYSISQIAYQCGYGNPRTFHRVFLAQRGMSPKQFRASLSIPSGEE